MNGWGRQLPKSEERGRANREIEKNALYLILSPSSSSRRIHAKNRPSNREGIIDKVDGVRMHVSLSEPVRQFIIEKREREREREN